MVFMPSSSVKGMRFREFNRETIKIYLGKNKTLKALPKVVGENFLI